MFSPLYSAGGVHVPHPMFMSFQGVPGASRLPYVPPFHPFPFSPFMPNGFPPRYPNGVFGGHYNGQGPPQLRKLFIGGLSHETTDDQLRQYYSQWGTVVDCIVIRDPQTKYSRGFGFVTFATMQMAEAAMADRPHTINNKVVDPKRAIPREQMSPLLPNHPPPFLEIEPDPGCKLSVSGIHWAWHTVDDLRQYFDNFGTVEQVEILGNPRGLGFVVFENKASADKCLEHGKIHIINGQKCEITRNPIEHTIYQDNELYSFDGNDSEEVDEQVDSASASGQETPDESSSSVKALENGFANNLNIVETENVCSTSCDAEKSPNVSKPKGNARNGTDKKAGKSSTKMEKENGNVKSGKEATEKKDVKDKREKKIQPAKNEKKKTKKGSKN